MAELLSHEEIEEELKTLDPSWSGSMVGLKRVIQFSTFPEAVHFVNLLAPECEAVNHHPDIFIRWRTVTLALSTHSAKGVTSADIDLARVIDYLAASQA